MTARITAAAVAQALADAGHTAAEWDPDVFDWISAGYRTAPGGTRRVLLFHEGYSDEASALTTYRTTLEKAGYQVTADRQHHGHGRRRLEVTRA